MDIFLVDKHDDGTYDFYRLEDAILEDGTPAKVRKLVDRRDRSSLQEDRDNLASRIDEGQKGLANYDNQLAAIDKLDTLTVTSGETSLQLG